jgi:hypothetical protein
MKTYKIKINDKVCEFVCRDIIDAYNIGLTKFGHIMSFEQMVTPLILIKIDHNIIEKSISVKLSGKNIIELYHINNNFNFETIYKEVVSILGLNIEVYE